MSRKGFTLVEMLVSVALVVLMMAMFAVVFQLAAGSMSTQRGIAENDQRARSAVTVIRADLAKRTFRNVLPFKPDDNGEDNQRRGYFYISENDPNDDTDDVLQFTVDASITTKDSDSTPYYGRAMTFGDDDYYSDNRNQPDGDDFNPSPDNTAESRLAEISYFLRGGRLYRRLLLIRNNRGESDQQPRESDGNERLFSISDPPSLGTYDGEFWRDFSFSALHTSDGAVFNTSESLSNSATFLVSQFPLGNPANRFGHFPGNGNPREYVEANRFIGRFTEEETSHEDFNYPQELSDIAGSLANPMSSDQLTLGERETVEQFRGGIHRGADMLLSNVHAFDIKLWDASVGIYVDIGGDGTSFADANRDNASYGPSGPSGNRVFDTWHPAIDLDEDGVDDDPPFILSEPLPAIRITIRFLDVSSNQLRNLTIDYSLTK